MKLDRRRFDTRKVLTALLLSLALSTQLVRAPAAAAANEAVNARDATEDTAGVGMRLRLVGGYRVPNVRIDSMNLFWGSGSIDALPGSGKWLMVHPKSVLLELKEPGRMGSGNPEGWPELQLQRSTKAMVDNENYGASAAIWLDKDTAMVSSRKSYRSGFDKGWLARVSFATDQETPYTIYSAENTHNENFHVLQALGAGFIRMTQDDWTQAHLPGFDYLLGRGGYDVLGSPLGPAIGAWREGESTAEFLLDYPKQYPARRDPYYIYPSRDPLTEERDLAQLPMWQMPDEAGGFWQAGNVGGIAYVSLPNFRAFIASANLGRGVFDYRSQGGGSGSGNAFLVTEPSAFYGPDGGRGRGGHREETGNASYPAGQHVSVAHVISPAHLAEVREGKRLPWEVPTARFDWPREGLEQYWDDKRLRLTTVQGLHWDNERQLLWAAMRFPFPIIAAYEVEYGEDITYSPAPLPPGWEGIFEPETNGSVVASGEDGAEDTGVNEGEPVTVRPETAWTARINSPAAGLLTTQQGQLYRLYLGILGRVPDAEGFRFWHSFLSSGATEIGLVAHSFTYSREFRQGADADGDNVITDPEFVAAMLSNLRNRAPTHEEISAWERRLKSERRENVLLDMLSIPVFLEGSYDMVAAFAFD